MTLKSYEDVRGSDILYYPLVQNGTKSFHVSSIVTFHFNIFRHQCVNLYCCCLFPSI